MRIAQIAPLYESCPPQLYGGTERVVSYLTEELVRMGHEVTLFASGDSQTKARLVPGCKRALRLDSHVTDPLAYHMIMMGRVLHDADQFDILHFHTDYLHYPTFTSGPHPIVTTLHGRQDLPDLPAVYREFSDTPLVSISDHQRIPLPRAHWMKTIHHGLPKYLLPFGAGDGGYLAFIGRISPEKRLDRAIEIACRAGISLKVAAKVDKADTKYFHDIIEPMICDGIEFIGEINEVEKREFLGNASALLFPIDWPEPFGLVMIEAMACGTPVLAFNRGSVAEVLENGVTGLVVDTMDEAHIALPEVLKLDRRRVRAEFDRRFSVERMAHDYVELYENLIRPPAPLVKPFIASGAGELYPALDLAAAARAAVAV